MEKSNVSEFNAVENKKMQHSFTMPVNNTVIPSPSMNNQEKKQIFKRVQSAQVPSIRSIEKRAPVEKTDTHHSRRLNVPKDMSKVYKKPTNKLDLFQVTSFIEPDANTERDLSVYSHDKSISIYSRMDVDYHYSMDDFVRSLFEIHFYKAGGIMHTVKEIFEMTSESRKPYTEF